MCETTTHTIGQKVLDMSATQDESATLQMSPESFDSRAKALPAKRSEKGYGDENEL